MAQVQALQPSVAEGIAWKGSESENRSRNFFYVGKMNMFGVPVLGLKPILLAYSADITNLEMEREKEPNQW